MQATAHPSPYSPCDCICIHKRYAAKHHGSRSFLPQGDVDAKALHQQRTLTTLCHQSYNSSITGSGLSPELRAALDKFVNENKIVLFIKGTKQFPQCGFSNTVVQIFNQLGVPYETINVLDNELIRSGMKEYSQWPTFPQVWIQGELFGGCDITLGS